MIYDENLTLSFAQLLISTETSPAEPGKTVAGIGHPDALLGLGLLLHGSQVSLEVAEEGRSRGGVGRHCC